jgi:hypothetical protein
MYFDLDLAIQVTRDPGNTLVIPDLRPEIAQSIA